MTRDRPVQPARTRVNDDVQSGHGTLLYAPAFYRIRIHGALAPAWSDWLGEWRLDAEQRATGHVTVLTGELADQAALLGILNQLNMLGYVLLSVEVLDEQAA